MTFLTTLAESLLALTWISSTVAVLYGTLRLERHFRSGPPHLDAPFALFPVSILKPLKGCEEGLDLNLESFFKLDYPDFELIFSAADSNDPACALVYSMMRKYPRVRARMIVGRVEVGLNPKVNNLAVAYREAHNDWLLISDSNTRVPTSYLKRMVAHLENGVGIVTSVVAGQDARSLGGMLEAASLNGFFARGMMLAEAAGRPVAMGKSMLFKRSEADRFGGIQALARYIAEDYMAGQAMRMLGLKIVTASDPVPQPIGRYPFKLYWSRHVRWGRIRKSQAPIAFLAEPLLNPLVSGLAGAGALWLATDGSLLPFVLAHLATWMLCDLCVLRRLDPKASPLAPIAWLIRETLALPLWAQTLLGTSVEWRGRKFEIRAGGLVET